IETDVIAVKPDLVLWQVGTNAIIGKLPFNPETLREGLARMKSAGAEVVLIDPQFAPAFITAADAERIGSVITAAGMAENVGVFHRFALMRYWHVIEHMPLRTFLSPDALHMNDWGYACFARSVATALTDASVGRKTTMTSIR